MRLPDVPYIRWAKALPAVRCNLARSSAPSCPPELLALSAADLVTNLPTHDGYAPLADTLARRYRVDRARVYAVSGGTSFATWLAILAALDGASRGAEVLVEQPAYEPLRLIPAALGCTVRRFERREEDGYAVDIARFRRMVTPRTRLAIVSHLHNPSGAPVEEETLAAMARAVKRVGGTLLVDEVYAEALFGRVTHSAVHAGVNVVTTSSLTKAYGLDGLRAGWLLGPPPLLARAAAINDLMTNNSVAPGERLALAALQHLPAIRRHAQAVLRPNLVRLRRYLRDEPRLSCPLPPGGSVAFARLPLGLDGDRVAAHLQRHYDTLVVPGRFFEAPDHVRLGMALPPDRLDEGLRNLSRTLDDLG